MNLLQPASLPLALSLALLAPAVMAQQTGTPTQLSQIDVVGSSLSRASPVSVKPVGPIEVISAQQIRQSGLTSVGDILARLSIFGSGTNTTANFGANGETCINLRSLGCNRVLVLVNGKRWPSLITGEVDLNTISLAIVDHIQILKSGASAEYGSGAMSGVVNIVTRAHLTGTQLRAYYGEYVDGGHHDGQTQMYSLTHGVNSERGSSVFNASFTYQRPILGGDRAITAFPNPGTGVTRGSSTIPQGRYVFVNPDTGRKEDLTIIPGTPGTSPSDYRPFNPLTDFYNFATANYLLTPSKRANLYAAGTYRLNDHLNFHYTALYNDRRSSQQGGPAEPPGGTQGQLPYDIPADQPFNPFGFALNALGPHPNLLLLSYQPVETGLRHWKENSQTFYVSTGVSGTFTFAMHPFDWGANIILNRNTMDTTDGPEVNLERWKLALGGPAVCGPGSPDPPCVPLNLFGGQFDGGGIKPDMWNYVSYTARSYITTNQHDFTAHVATPLAQLPAGPLQATLRYEYLYDSGDFRPDALAALGESTLGTTPGANSGPPISGAYHMNAAALEFNVPLLKDAPAAKALDLDVAGRRSQYNIFGGVDSRLAALQWTVNDQLAFRASWSRDFNAPDVTQLFSASVAGSADVADPCSNYSAAGGNPTVAANCRAAGVPATYRQIANAVLTTSGRNPNLKPETSTSRTLAASWQPVQDLPLTLNADYFKIGIRDAISGSVPQDLLDGCYISGAANLCNLVTRNGTGAITNLDTGNINLGSLRTEGLDFGVDYSLATDRFGTFGFNWMTTWMKLFTETQPNFSDPAQPIVTRLAHRETGHAGYPTIKSLLTATWTYHRWQAMWQIQYFNALVEPCSDRYDGTPLSFTNLGLCSNPDFTNNHLSTNKLGAVAFSNVQARYRFAAHGPTLIVGINNIFNRVPPISHAAGGYDKTLYPIPGRFPYVSVAYAF